MTPRNKLICLTTLIVLAGLLLPSCEKFSNGKEVIINRTVDANFTTIFLKDDVDLVITQGDRYEIRLEGGENLLPNIKTDISDSILTIANTNKYDWMRSYDKKLIAHVTLPHLFILQYEATSTVSNIDTIREDSLTVTALGGSGYINLLIKTNVAKLSIIKGSADMIVSGKSGLSFISSNGYGPFRCIDLKSNYTFMRNASSNDCYVNAQEYLEYEINGRGNIYYRGNPISISGWTTGSGILVKLD